MNGYDEIQAGQNGGEARDEDRAVAVAMTYPFEYVGAQGRIERPPGIDPAGDQSRRRVIKPPIDVNVPAQ